MLNTYKYGHINFNRIFIDEADSVRTVVDYDNQYIIVICVVYYGSSTENLRYVYPIYNYNQELGYSEKKGASYKPKFVKETFNSFHGKLIVHKKFSFKCDQSFIDKSIKIPDMVLKEILCKNPKVLSILNNLISQKTVDKINAGDIKGAVVLV